MEVTELIAAAVESSPPESAALARFMESQPPNELFVILAIIGIVILIIGGFILAGWLVLSGLDGLSRRYR